MYLLEYLRSYKIPYNSNILILHDFLPNYCRFYGFTKHEKCQYADEAKEFDMLRKINQHCNSNFARKRMAPQVRFANKYGVIWRSCIRFQDGYVSKISVLAIIITKSIFCLTLGKRKYVSIIEG